MRTKIMDRSAIQRLQFRTGATDRAKAEKLLKTFYSHFRISPRLRWIDEPIDLSHWLMKSTAYWRQKAFLRAAYVQSIEYAYARETTEFAQHTRLANARTFPHLSKEMFRQFNPMLGDPNSGTICKFSAPMLLGLETISEILPLYDATVLRGLARLFLDLFDVAFGVMLRKDECLLIPNLDQAELTADGDLSSRDGPALRIGSEQLFAIEGILVPSAVAKRALLVRHAATPGDHPEAKRVISDLHESLSDTYTLALIELLGWKAFMSMPQTAKHRVIRSHNPRLGVLYEVRLGGMGHLFVVKVTNATALPDGSFEDFYLRVDPELRPLPDPANPRSRRGAPQEATVLNAVASTWGMRGAEYLTILGAES